jgi:hypothetical protein
MQSPMRHGSGHFLLQYAPFATQGVDLLSGKLLIAAAAFWLTT